MMSAEDLVLLLGDINLDAVLRVADYPSLGEDSVVEAASIGPGGGAGPDASPTEKVYYVLSGELTLIVGGKESVLKANDSCFIGPNEPREIVNRGNDVVTMLVAVSTPQK